MRERSLVEAFVAIADTLVAGFDVVDYLDGLANRCVRLLDVQAAGLLLADVSARPQVVATSSHQAHVLEVFETQADQGPCVECMRTGGLVVDIDDPEQVRPEPDRWAVFTRMRRELGFGSVYAIPLRLREEVIGALNLFRTSATALDESDVVLARGLADMAAIGLLQERAVQSRGLVAEQLQTALNTRVSIEQAKGVLAERLGLDMERAFGALRQLARSHHLSLTEAARLILDNELIEPITRGGSQSVRRRTSNPSEPPG